MLKSIVHNVKTASIKSAKIAVGATGGLIGGTAGLVAGVAVGATVGTINGCSAGAKMALGMVWPDHKEGEAEELARQTATDIRTEIRAEIRAIEKEMRDLAGPAGKPKKGPGRPRKNRSYGPGFENVQTARIKIDGRELDDQEVRDFLSGKAHLRPDPIF